MFFTCFFVTHAGILTSIQSSRPHDRPSARIERSSTDLTYVRSQSFGVILSPRYFRRGTARPVSYYALFKGIAASKPTSWLFKQFHILYHLA